MWGCLVVCVCHSLEVEIRGHPGKNRVFPSTMWICWTQVRLGRICQVICCAILPTQIPNDWYFVLYSVMTFGALDRGWGTHMRAPWVCFRAYWKVMLKALLRLHGE